MRQTKKVWITVLLIVIAVVLLFALCCRKMPAKLSQLNDRDLNQYLAFIGPNHEELPAKALRYVREEISRFENDPDYVSAINMFSLEQLEREREFYLNIIAVYESIANKWILFGRFVVG